MAIIPDIFGEHFDLGDLGHVDGLLARAGENPDPEEKPAEEQAPAAPPPPLDPSA